MNQASHFINGCWQVGSGEGFEKHNPGDNALI